MSVQTTSETKMPPPKERFKTNLISFVQHMGGTMKEFLPNNVNPLIMSMVLSVVRNASSDLMMDKFIERSKCYWDAIYNKEEKTLLDSILILFKDLPEDQVKSMSNLFTAKDANGLSVITQEKKDVIWNYVWSFIKISIKHIHITRQPKINDRGVRSYTVEYFKEISIRINAEKWKIQVDE